MKLQFAQRALSEIERGKREWLARRDKNPERFEEELAEVFENIKTVPALGSPMGMMSRGKLVRRMEMRKTKYQVYYRLQSDEVALVLSVWGGRRGRSAAHARPLLSDATPYAVDGQPRGG